MAPLQPPFPDVCQDMKPVFWVSLGPSGSNMSIRQIRKLSSHLSKNKCMETIEIESGGAEQIVDEFAQNLHWGHTPCPPHGKLVEHGAVAVVRVRLGLGLGFIP